MASVMLMGGAPARSGVNAGAHRVIPNWRPQPTRPMVAVPTFCRRCAFRLPCYGERVFEW